MTDIAVLGGTGRHGGGLARRFAAAGQRVIVGSRDPDRGRATVSAWGSPGIQIADYASAVRSAAIVVLALPFRSVDAMLGEVAGHFSSGSLVVDVTVPLEFAAGKMVMIDVPEGSATQHIRTLLPPAVDLAGTFKTVPAGLLGETHAALDCDEFVCGDSDTARAEAAALVRLVPGLRPVDVGPLSRARYIEHMTALAVVINRKHKIHDARFRVVGLP